MGASIVLPNALALARDPGVTGEERPAFYDFTILVFFFFENWIQSSPSLNPSGAPPPRRAL